MKTLLGCDVYPKLVKPLIYPLEANRFLALIYLLVVLLFLLSRWRNFLLQYSLHSEFYLTGAPGKFFIKYYTKPLWGVFRVFLFFLIPHGLAYFYFHVGDYNTGGVRELMLLLTGSGIITIWMLSIFLFLMLFVFSGVGDHLYLPILSLIIISVILVAELCCTNGSSYYVSMTCIRGSNDGLTMLYNYDRDVRNTHAFVIRLLLMGSIGMAIFFYSECCKLMFHRIEGNGESERSPGVYTTLLARY